MTSETFYGAGELGTSEALMIAAAIGVAFGFFLERAGFGSSRKLVSIFYFKDFAVFKVMFTAIITTMLGARVLTLTGLADPDGWYQLETVLWPQITAGLVFGVGFVMGGWCPGTAVVGAASGRWDALVFLGGTALGSLGYAFVYPAIQRFATEGGEISTLPAALGMNPGVVSLIVVVLAIAAFVGSNHLVAWKARHTS